MIAGLRRKSVVKILLTFSSGPLTGPDAPAALLWYWADPFGNRTATLVRRSTAPPHPGAWEEVRRSFGAPEAEAIDALLVEMGVPGRSPDVHGIVDTSDGQHNVLLHGITLDGSEFHHLLRTCSSGYDGSDAGRFRSLLVRLLALVEVHRDTEGPLAYWLGD